MPDALVSVIKDVAGRRSLTEAEARPQRNAPFAPGGAVVEATDEDGLELFVPGVHGLSTGTDEWVVYPG